MSIVRVSFNARFCISIILRYLFIIPIDHVQFTAIGVMTLFHLVNAGFSRFLSRLTRVIHSPQC